MRAAGELRMDDMRAEDWPAVARIYAEGIGGGNATFETEVPAFEQWDAEHLAAPRLVARRAGEVVGWAALAPASRRRAYAGVANLSVYVAAAAAGHGVGRALLAALIEGSEQAGLWTLQAGIFPENAASLALHRRLGFRTVGVQERIGQLNGRWRDVVLLERRSPAV